MFHVKHSVNSLNEGILLSDTELPEDHVEDVLDIDSAQKPAEGMRRGPEIFGHEFVALPNRSERTTQRLRGIRNELPLPLPCDQATFASTKIVLREIHQGCDQLRQTGAAPRRNPELGHWPTLAIDRAGTRPDEVDLVTHQPDRRGSVVL